tara:strand:- start:94 stop:528 length:435 start_codon:yes stop_codon:yes gene_type:complete
MQIVKISLIIFFLTTTSVFSDDRSSLKYFRASIDEIQTLFTYAENVTKTQGSSGTITNTQVQKIINHAKKSFEFSKLVKNDDLDWLDPSLLIKSLSKNYENLFRKGLIIYIEAWENGDPAKGVEANKLLNKWGKYYKKIRKKII